MPRGHYDISGNPKPTPKPPTDAKPKSARPAPSASSRGAESNAERVDNKSTTVAAGYSNMAGERDIEVVSKGRGPDVPSMAMDGDAVLAERLEELSVGGGERRKGKGKGKEGGVEGEEDGG